MTERQEFLFENVFAPTPSKPIAPVLPHQWLEPPEEPRPKREEKRKYQAKEYPVRPSHRLALERVLDSYRLKLNGYRLETAYYRYSGLSHTIRIRNRRVYVRVSHYFEDQPERVIEAVGHILLRKLLRMRPLKREVEICRLAEQELEGRVETKPRKEVDPETGNHHFLPGEGRVHDLVEMKRRLCERYFPGEGEEAPVFWSSKRVRGYWGKYFQNPARIVINRRLDSPKVPGYVVEAVLHHEMLHHVLGIPVVAGRRRPHSRKFREAERRYPMFHEAEKFLKNF
ncbi:MAG: hypothetical protein H6752_00475 [Candidatus Omnitrophica bacterium]|nr:hypothetical protein [Candidatus Omnitrophota bacterium]